MSMILSRDILLALVTVSIFLFTSCTYNKISSQKNIIYGDSSIKKQQLNIFYPHESQELRPVLIFIHGGNWNSGNKSLYSYLGKRFARKGVVTVVIGYPYHPAGNYNQMATSCATAVSWLKNNIKGYGGDPEKLFISGHSAGGHLAALTSLREQYFDSLGMDNPIKGTILIDAAGLDMYGYLKKVNLKSDHHYFKVFGNETTMWKAATPLFHLNEKMPAFLIFVGEKTYPSIWESNGKFIKEVKKIAPQTTFKILKGKKHVPMITQFLNSNNPVYNDILKFMGVEK